MSKIEDLKARLPEGLRNTVLTVEDVQLMVDAAIEDKGADYVYPLAGLSCQYFDGADLLHQHGIEVTEDVVPGCIFGHVASYVGTTWGDLPSDVNNSGIISLFDSCAIRYDDTAAGYAVRVQDQQDSGASWGEAKYQADEILFIMREHGLTWEAAAEQCDQNV